MNKKYRIKRVNNPNTILKVGILTDCGLTAVYKDQAYNWYCSSKEGSSWFKNPTPISMELEEFDENNNVSTNKNYKCDLELQMFLYNKMLDGITIISADDIMFTMPNNGDSNPIPSEISQNSDDNTLAVLKKSNLNYGGGFTEEDVMNLSKKHQSERINICLNLILRTLDFESMAILVENIKERIPK